MGEQMEDGGEESSLYGVNDPEFWIFAGMSICKYYLFYKIDKKY